MKKTICRLMLLLLPLLASPAFAGYIVAGVDGPISSTFAAEPGPAGIEGVTPQAWAVAWVQGIGYTHAAIRANLLDGSFGWAGGTAYLTTQIGGFVNPLIDEVAQATFVADPYTDSWVTLFSGLTLPAGTYYLTLAPTFVSGSSDTNMLWNTTVSPTVTLGAGVTRGDLTYNEQFNLRLDLNQDPNSDPYYAPSWAVNVSDLNADGNLMFDVSVPEPATWTFLLIAGVAVLSFRWRTARKGAA